jgi:putative tryptophan/tyrosine transport system substrate-binding protein
MRYAAPSWLGQRMQFDRLKRRSFITLLGGAAAVWPLAARAQQPMPVIGFVSPGSPQSFVRPLAGFLKGLGEAGYVEGRNVAIEYRWSGDRSDRLRAMIDDLVHRKVSVLAVLGSTPAALAAKAASSTIPIIFNIAADPVQVGLVASINRPGGNVTGIVTLNVEIAPKRLELLHELFPTATSFALLVNPANPALAEPVSEHVQAAARTLGVKLHVLHVSSEAELDAVPATAARLLVAGLVVGPDLFFNSRIEQLAALSSRHALPAVFQWREFTAAGGLLSYGTSITETYRQSGVYTGRVLKGEKPADLPVEQTTKVELFINLKAAKALGISVPTALLVRADEVIE